MNPLNIVIVDRNTKAREALEDLLTADGFEVQGFATTEAAIAGLKEGPSIVLLHSLMSPETSLGFVALAEHEQYLLRIAESIVSAKTLTEQTSHEIPAPVESGTQTIQNVIEERRLLQEAAAQKMRAERMASVARSGTRAAVRPRHPVAAVHKRTSGV